MFRRIVTWLEVMALAGLGLILIAGPAKAQQGWPMNGSNWSYYGPSSGSFQSSYSPGAEATYPSGESPYYVTYPIASPYYYAAYPSSFSGYYGSSGATGYYGPSTSTSLGERPAFIHLNVPSNAKVWFDGAPTNQTGTSRSFESPPLSVGRDYTYQIRIQWRRDGKDMNQTRQIDVRANDMINLTLDSSPGFALAK